MSLADTLRDWRDFYAVIGAAAATLLGAMFVVASLGAGYVTRSHLAGFRLFVTPIVIHLCVILFTVAAMVVPGLGSGVLGAVLGAVGIVSLAYSGKVWTRINLRDGTDTDDLIWYALVPLPAYAAMVGAAIFLWQGLTMGLYILAAALAVLLAACIRNAWDMILYFVIKNRRK